MQHKKPNHPSTFQGRKLTEVYGEDEDGEFRTRQTGFLWRGAMTFLERMRDVDEVQRARVIVKVSDCAVYTQAKLKLRQVKAMDNFGVHAASYAW